MSNLEQSPTETECGGVAVADAPEVREVLAPREVPLGGPRAMTVRRTLPHRERRMVGAWCFVDHYGPRRLEGGPGMDVPPHPHTGLQTVSWLLEGEVLHRDSLGSHQMVTPGQLNLMTAGHGIAHSEETPAVADRQRDTLAGVQLWVALPRESRDVAAHFEHHADLPVLDGPGSKTRVVMGAVDGAASPAATYSPLVGAEVVLDDDASAVLPLDPAFEHAVLAMEGDVEVGGHPVAFGELCYLPPGRTSLDLASGSGSGSGSGSTALLIGGVPFEEQVVMWWNFLGTDHDEIAAARAAWEAQTDRFGTVEAYDGSWLHAPALPNAQLRARGRTR